MRDIKGSVEDPFQLRVGETDTFYAIFADLLGSSDTISGTPTATSDGLTVTGAAKNPTPLELSGVTYAIDTVVSFNATGIALGDKAEVAVTISATSGRGPLIASVWIEGVATYAV